VFLIENLKQGDLSSKLNVADDLQVGTVLVLLWNWFDVPSLMGDIIQGFIFVYGTLDHQAAFILANVPVWVEAVIFAPVAGWYMPGDIVMVCVVNALVVVDHRSRREGYALLDE
jgi:hypothetical protein